MEEKGKSRVTLRTHAREKSEALDTRARPVSLESTMLSPPCGQCPGSPLPARFWPRSRVTSCTLLTLSTQRNQRAKPLKDPARSSTPGVSKPCKAETVLPHSVGVERRALLPQGWIYIGSFHFEKHTDLNSFSRNSILSSLLIFPWC